MTFNQATRQNIRRVGAADYSAGSTTSVTLPRVGYLARIHLHVTGTLTVTPGTGSATLSEKGIASLLRRVRFQANNGNDIFNVSGYGAHLVDSFSRLDYEPYNGKTSPGYQTEIYDVSVDSGANEVEFGITIPVTPNERDVAGLMLLQSEGLVTQVVFEWQYAGGATNDYPVVLTGDATASFTGEAEVYLETFTVPNLVEDQPPVDTMYQTIETVQPISSIGENSVALLRANTYQRIIHIVELNGSLNTTDVEKRAFRYNRTEIPYELGRKMDLQLTRRRWGRDFPTGTFVWEFYSQGYPNFGGGRDLVDANALAELESLIYIASDATLGSGNNNIRTITQQFVRLD